MDQLSNGIPGVLGYMDDFIIASRSIKEHYRTLYQFFQRIQEFGFHIQLGKCKFLVQQIKFFGQIVTPNGIKPDSERTKALQNMPPPHDVSTLRSFLDLALTHFNPDLTIIVTADASNKGIGATISHRFNDGKEKVFQHAARTLTKTEQAYSQIEKEGLGLIFAIQKFHQFIFGRKFILRTDHRPLLGIFGSKSGIPIFSASRLQRWALILLNYDFSIEFVRTDCTGQADALSRLISDQRSSSKDEDVVIAQLLADTEADVAHVFNTQTEQLPLTAKEIAEAQRNDPLIREVLDCTMGRWPNKGLNPEIKPYFTVRNNLSIISDCLVFNGRTIIPQALRDRILKALHLAHPGIVRMKSLARELVYWPSMDADIESLVKSCVPCQEAAKRPAKQPLQPWPATTSVFERVHIDLAGPCSNVSSQLQWLFDRYGVPKTLVSDNGPQFSSSVFEEFCKNNGIKHIFSPPYHPQSNGAAERYVDYFKRQLKKCSGQRSPAELFLGRKLRTKLSLMRPETTSKQQHHENTSKMKLQFDKKHNLGNRIVTRHANQIRTTMAQSGDKTCSVADDIIFAREEHGTGNETTDDQQTNTQPQQQAAQQEEQGQNQQPLPLRRSERTRKSVRFLSPTHTGQKKARKESENEIRKEAEAEARKELEEEAQKEAEKKAQKKAEEAKENTQKEAEEAKAQKEAEEAKEKAQNEAEEAKEKTQKEAEQVKAQKEREEKAKKKTEGEEKDTIIARGIKKRRLTEAEKEERSQKDAEEKSRREITYIVKEVEEEAKQRQIQNKIEELAAKLVGKTRNQMGEEEAKELEKERKRFENPPEPQRERMPFYSSTVARFECQSELAAAKPRGRERNLGMSGKRMLTSVLKSAVGTVNDRPCIPPKGLNRDILKRRPTPAPVPQFTTRSVERSPVRKTYAPFRKGMPLQRAEEAIYKIRKSLLEAADALSELADELFPHGEAREKEEEKKGGQRAQWGEPGPSHFFM
ncbi:hypothetical protein niasHS_009595 [Heterodera schachtii]|uniref:RNA-directed DNA polymerase n=1 Tax=Heterodera schachtii TaxID=97005 RepID=A0ABD2JBA5_HETSC